MIGKQFLSSSSLSDLVHTTLLQFCGIKIKTKMDIKVRVKIKAKIGCCAVRDVSRHRLEPNHFCQYDKLGILYHGKSLVPRCLANVGNGSLNAALDAGCARTQRPQRHVCALVKGRAGSSKCFHPTCFSFLHTFPRFTSFFLSSCTKQRSLSLSFHQLIINQSWFPSPPKRFQSAA